jgi:hypothetical protein
MLGLEWALLWLQKEDLGATVAPSKDEGCSQLGNLGARVFWLPRL